jgi:cell fate (sporulation/competence/biofilm development) regulator YmcA (YheA/YmcA/DUF963 family)
VSLELDSMTTARARALALAEAIGTQLRCSEEAARFWQARAKMERHRRAQELFDELKRKTNASLVLQYRLEPEHPKVLLAEREVREVEEQLYQIPVAMQYKEAQAELNELVQGVIQVLLARLAQELPVELGPRGCGGGGSCGCHG